MSILRYYFKEEKGNDIRTLLRIPNVLISSLDMIHASITEEKKLVVVGTEVRDGVSYEFVASVNLTDDIDPNSLTKHQFGEILTIRGKVFGPKVFFVENTNPESVVISCEFNEPIDQQKLAIVVDRELTITYKSWSKKIVLTDRVDAAGASYSIDNNHLKICFPKIKVSQQKFYLCGGQA